jgi:hypothetical protein
MKNCENICELIGEARIDVEQGQPCLEYMANRMALKYAFNFKCVGHERLNHHLQQLWREEETITTLLGLVRHEAEF